ncbi:MAG: class I SAM-dependent methyltransferase [Deltaproteobacteria bacterium]|nr:class I SAM-dependent methyltransferase [Deltaproteobacteria bacterium]
MKAVSTNVWHIAQKSEMLFWDKKRYEPARLIEAIRDKYVLFTEIKKIYPQILAEPPDIGRALEIGIGPLCLGVVSILEPAEKWEITGIDPLPRMALPKLPSYLEAFFSELYKKNMTYVQTPAEEFNNPVDSFNLVICDNVLEHTYNPHKIINNIYNLLVPGGFLVLRENTLSHLSKWRKKIFYTKYHDEAHPVSFTYHDLINIVKQTHFNLIYSNRDKYDMIKRICFKSRRIIIIANKPE